MCAMAFAVSLFASSRPIGVFDSGIGGMTVLDKMLTMDLYDNATHERKSDGKPDFANERFVYLGDQANMPYGDYAAAGKSEYLKKLILADAGFLLSENAKTVVIACNTATAWGLEGVSKKTAKENVDTIGVIGAGVESAFSHPLVRNAKGAISIGVMATPGTIASGAYARAIAAEAKKRGIEFPVSTVSQGCAGLADAVEAGDPKAGEIAAANYRELLARHSSMTNAGPLKVVILGCTHYPFVLSSLEREAPGTVFVDPALATAEKCYLNLLEKKILSGEGGMRLSAFVSVPAPNLDKRFLDGKGNLARSCKYGREVDDDTLWTAIKPYGFNEAKENAFVRESLGAVWKLLSSGKR